MVTHELHRLRYKGASHSTRGLNPGRCAEYDRKKYVWKLLYIYMLGYEVEFGHKQAADLIPATRYRGRFV